MRTRKPGPQRMSQRKARSAGLRQEPVDEVPSAKGGRACPQGNLKVTLILFIPKPVPDGKRPWEVSVPKITTNSLGPWSLWRARGLDKNPSHSWVLGEAVRGYERNKSVSTSVTARITRVMSRTPCPIQEAVHTAPEQHGLNFTTAKSRA